MTTEGEEKDKDMERTVETKEEITEMSTGDGPMGSYSKMQCSMHSTRHSLLFMMKSGMISKHSCRSPYLLAFD